MNHPLTTFAIRTLLSATSQKKAISQTLILLGKYQLLSHSLTVEQGQRGIEVPPMHGVDENMRRWSYFMLMEHNAIVNRSITALIVQLANGEELHGAAIINPKHDVMPSPHADETQLENFTNSIDEHIHAVTALGSLRKTERARHPLFGDFNAHKWHSLFPFHIKIHYPQAAFITNQVQEKTY